MAAYKCLSPILLMAWNRPERTKHVIESIRKVEPKLLYVALDGPRDEHGADQNNIQCVIELIKESIDWDCHVEWKIREWNLGCKMACTTAIDWFFEHVPEGIIIEDDCVANDDFYRFCDELLVRYRNEKKVWQICGNYALQIDDYPSNYFFSNYGSLWGWASWRDRWCHYEVEISEADLKHARALYERDYDQSAQVEFRYRCLESIYKGYDTWDPQWAFCKHKHGGINLVSSTNLVKNIGFGEDATHTKNLKDLRANLQTNELDFPLIDNDLIEVDRRLDQIYFNTVLNPKVSLWIRLKHKLKTMIQDVHTG